MKFDAANEGERPSFDLAMPPLPATGNEVILHAKVEAGSDPVIEYHGLSKEEVEAMIASGELPAPAFTARELSPEEVEAMRAKAEELAASLPADCVPPEGAITVPGTGASNLILRAAPAASQ